MEPRVGKVVNGAIVLEDTEDLTEGAAVTVWIDSPSDSVTVSREELEVIDRGVAEADRGELLDARAFLQQLRSGG
ncbi:MAG: hypothetical protein AAF799_23000 [Myxococcota bacterium]